MFPFVLGPAGYIHLRPDLVTLGDDPDLDATLVFFLLTPALGLGRSTSSSVAFSSFPLLLLFLTPAFSFWSLIPDLWPGEEAFFERAETDFFFGDLSAAIAEDDAAFFRGDRDLEGDEPRLELTVVGLKFLRFKRTTYK